MAKLFNGLPEAARAGLKKTPQPAWVSPMLATLTKERFSREGWIYEPKLDGERCLGWRRGSSVSLLSRNKKELNDSYPELVTAITADSTHDFIIDGEVVAFDGERTSFEKLQGRFGLHDSREALASRIPVYYYIFDIIYLDGYDLRALPLRYRKELLKKALSFRDPLRFTTHVEREGVAYYQEACSRGWEGIMAKRYDSPYVPVRSRDWLKFKCVSEQELVIGGYTDPRGSRTGFGALLVGYYDKGKLMYAGKVGTGYNEETLASLGAELASLEQQSSPFAQAIKEKGVHWVKPELVAQIGFTEWTSYDHLRHPRFLGLRRDKAARQVVKEG